MSKIRLITIFLFHFLVTFIIYLPSVHSKFVFDFIDFAVQVKEKGGTVLVPGNQNLSPYIASKAIFIALLRFWKFNNWAWYIITVLFHAFNGTIVAIILLDISQNLRLRNSLLMASSASLIFILSPYHTEAVVWGGAFNYQLTSFFILIHLMFSWKYLESRGILYLVLAVISLLFAAFSHEWGLLLLPADILMVSLFSSNFKSRAQPKNYLLPAIFPIILIYFINQYLSGEIIGHYGAKTHLQVSTAQIILSYLRYLAKIFLFSGFYSFRWQEKIYTSFEMGCLWNLFFFSVLIFFGFLVYKHWRLKRKWSVSLFYFLLFALFLFPVLNLYFPYWVKIQADRYCYLPVAFGWCGIVILFSEYKYLVVLFTVIIIYISVILLSQNIYSWKVAGEFTSSLDRDFRWWNAKRIFILNIPDNFRGAYIYRTGFGSGFAMAQVKYGKENILREKTYDVCSYNLNEKSDSISIRKINDKTLKIILNAPGDWFWGTNGVIKHADFSWMKMDINEDNTYTVIFKDKRPGDIFIYQAKGKWRTLEDF